MDAVQRQIDSDYGPGGARETLWGAGHQPSFFKGFKFNSTVIYIVFYVRMNHRNDMISIGYISDHLASHKFSMHHGHFIQLEGAIGDPISPIYPIYPIYPVVEWVTNDKTIVEFIADKSDHEMSSLSVWMQILGVSTFLGPVHV
jgi:hypothetical protein